MRRFAAAFVSIALCASQAVAQITLPFSAPGLRPQGRLLGSASVPTCSDTDATAFEARKTTPPTVQQAYLDCTLITDLKTAGTWSLIGEMYVLAAADTQSALLNWKSATHNLTASGSPAFTPLVGYTGSTSNYLTTGIAPASLSTGTQNSFAFGAFLVGTAQNVGTAVIGNDGTSATLRVQMYPDVTNGTPVRGRNMTSAQMDGTITIPSRLGFTVFNRTILTSVDIWKDGAKLETVVNASATPSSQTDPIAVFRNGTNYATDTIGAVVFSSGWTDPQAAATYTAFHSYLVSVGATS